MVYNTLINGLLDTISTVKNRLHDTIKIDLKTLKLSKSNFHQGNCSVKSHSSQYNHKTQLTQILTFVFPLHNYVNFIDSR